MGLNERYRLGFLRQVESAVKGDVTYIPNPLARVGNSFNLMHSRYTLVSGATGSGKTSFVDYEYVLAPYTYLKNNQDDIHWEVDYFSLERKAMFKHAKWISWMIYRDKGLLMSADDLMGWGTSNLNQSGYDFIRGYDDEISDLLSKVNIYDGKVSVEVLRSIIKKKARKLGTFFYTTADELFVDDNPIPIKSFKDDGQVEHTKEGDKFYLTFTHNGEEIKLFENDHIYFLKNPKTFYYIIIDGINLLGDKEVLDAVSVELANARDLYGFSPVVITQQNRAMGDIQRIKLHGADLSPQIEDIFKSSQMGFDADLVLGLFDAYRYKAYDQSGCYEGYRLKPSNTGMSNPSMQAPSGHSRFRSLHILKNTFGADGCKYGLKFLGEVNHFETLPFPDDPAMDAVYADIRRGL